METRINAIPKSIKNEIKKSLETNAEKIVNSMKSYVPVDTGSLKNSIGWTWGRPPKGAMILGRASSQLGGELTITIYAGNAKTMVAGKDGKFEHQLARLIEFGTKEMSAQPFFYPVWRINKKAIKRDINKSIRKAVKNAKS